MTTLAPTAPHDTAVLIDRANATGLRPVVLIHGLWLLPESWDRWAAAFEDAGYAAVAAGWPGDPRTVADAHAHPEVFARRTVGDIAAHIEGLVRGLDRRPVLVGHSFGGLFAQMLAGRGLAAATVAISPAPFRGVLPLPVSAVRSAFPVLSNPANRGRAVSLSFEQFRYAFAGAVDEDEARELYATFSVPAAGAPLFQAATANLSPWTELKVDTTNPERGPLLIVSGDRDAIVPRSIAHASFKRQRRNPGVTELLELPGRGHSLAIDSGWREVADRVLAWVARVAPGYS